MPAGSSGQEPAVPVSPDKLSLQEFFNYLMRNPDRWRQRLEDSKTRREALEQFVNKPTQGMLDALEGLDWASFKELANVFGEKDPKYSITA